MSDDEPFRKIHGSVGEVLSEPQDGQVATNKYIYTVIQKMVHQRDTQIQDMVQREVRAAFDAAHRYKDVMAATSKHSDPPNAPKRRRTEARSQTPTGANFPTVFSLRVNPSSVSTVLRNSDA